MWLSFEKSPRKVLKLKKIKNDTQMSATSGVDWLIDFIENWYTTIWQKIYLNWTQYMKFPCNYHSMKALFKIIYNVFYYVEFQIGKTDKLFIWIISLIVVHVQYYAFKEKWIYLYMYLNIYNYIYIYIYISV